MGKPKSKPIMTITKRRKRNSTTLKNKKGGKEINKKILPGPGFEPGSSFAVLWRWNILTGCEEAPGFYCGAHWCSHRASNPRSSIVLLDVLPLH